MSLVSHDRRTPPAIPPEDGGVEGDRNFVTALARGLALLAQFSPESPKLTLVELCQKSGLAKTTVHRLLRTLSQLGYVAYDEDARRYFPGPRVMALGFSALAGMEIRDYARPYLVALSQRLNETVNLAIRDGLELVYCERIATRQIININLHVGARLPLHNTSMGRCLVAFLPPDERRLLLESLLSTIAVSEGHKILREHVALGHRFGYTINDEDLASGLRSIAAPVWGRERRVIAAVNVAVPSARTSLQQLRKAVAPLLLECTKSISLSAGATEAWIDGGWRGAIVEPEASPAEFREGRDGRRRRA